MQRLKNQFNLSELSGAMADLGTMLPLALALVVYCDFPLSRLFFFWGLTYIASGYIFKIPVSVQPLKAMSVIAIAAGVEAQLLSSTAVFYGLILLALYLSGTIKFLQNIFSETLIRGIQVGIGLILGCKALKLLIEKGVFLNQTNDSLMLNIVLSLVFLLIILGLQFYFRSPVIFWLIALSIIVAKTIGYQASITEGSVFNFAIPKLSCFANVFILLIIPQLPLTLGNAIFAADQISHDLFGKQAQNISPGQLSLSIALSNIIIGLGGGFPICHGAGGIASHARFGAKTGGSTIMLGAILVYFALVQDLSTLLLLIPSSLLATLLFLSALKLISFISKLKTKQEILIALIVALISFISRNLFIAITVGLALELLFTFSNKRTTIHDRHKP